MMSMFPLPDAGIREFSFVRAVAYYSYKRHRLARIDSRHFQNEATCDFLGSCDGVEHRPLRDRRERSDHGSRLSSAPGCHNLGRLILRYADARGRPIIQLEFATHTGG
jgi:hypothetical protein